MALFRLDMQQILRIFEICGTYTATWPIAPEVQGFQRFLRNCYWAFMTVNLFLTALSIGAFAYKARDDTIPMIKALCQLTAFIESGLTVFLARIQNDKIQIVLTRTKEFVKTANAADAAILQRRINHYLTFYTCATLFYLTCTTTFVLAPFLGTQEYMLDTWFPFNTDDISTKIIVFTSQFIALYETSFLFVFELVIAMFMWYPSARLEMLIAELQSVTEEKEFMSCIKKHQEIIQYLRDANKAIHPLICKTNATLASASICAVFPLLRPQHIDVIIQLVTMLGSVFERLFMLAWPADDLKVISQQVSYFVYGWPWIGKSRGAGKNVGTMLYRTQKPLTINMIFLPPLSLEYFATFLKTLLSYFMALRSAIGID